MSILSAVLWEGYYVWLGSNSPTSSAKPKPADEVLIEATVRNVKVDGLKVNVCRRIGVFEQALLEVVASLILCHFGDRHCI